MDLELKIGWFLRLASEPMWLFGVICRAFVALDLNPSIRDADLWLLQRSSRQRFICYEPWSTLSWWLLLWLFGAASWSSDYQFTWMACSWRCSTCVCCPYLVCRTLLGCNSRQLRTYTSLRSCSTSTSFCFRCPVAIVGFGKRAKYLLPLFVISSMAIGCSSRTVVHRLSLDLFQIFVYRWPLTLLCSEVLNSCFSTSQFDSW